MRLEGSLRCIADLTPEALSPFQRDINPEWIEAALQASGTATLRKRRRPAAQVIWLVIGMALFRTKSITDVAMSPDLALPTGAGGPTAARSAVSKARSRLGEEPLGWLFSRCAHEWAHAVVRSDDLAHTWQHAPATDDHRGGGSGMARRVFEE